MANIAAGQATRPSVSHGRARALVLLGAAVDLAASAFVLGAMFRLHPTVLAMEGSTLCARAAVFLVPAAIALLALIKGSSLLATAVVLNFGTLIVVPESLVVGPIILLAMLPLVFAWIALREEDHVRGSWGPAITAILGIAAAIVLAVAPHRSVSYTLLSRHGRVVQSSAIVERDCPSSLFGSSSGDFATESGCDPVVQAPYAEIALGTSALALVAAASLRARRNDGAAKGIAKARAS